MKHSFLFILLSVAACSNEAATSEADPLDGQLWLDDGRSGLCKSGEGIAFIVYADDGSNCSAEGTYQLSSDDGLAFIPRGDEECRIPLTIDGDVLTFGDGGDACSYYCGGSAVLDGQALRLSADTERRLEDAAGYPLC